MSGRRTGIIAAPEGGTLLDEPLNYSSERSHLLVDPSPSKGHLKILEMNGGIMLTVSTNTPETKEYIFYSQDHKVTAFIPRVSVRFYTRQVPPALSGTEGQYSSYLFAGGVPFSESVFFRVDEKKVYFVHQVRSTSGPSQSYNSIMQDILFRIKLTIFQNEGLDEPYDSVLQS